MIKKNSPLILLFLLASAISVPAQETISPKDYGILNAPNDSARYMILSQVHMDAITQGKIVDYQGIDTLKLAIPSNAKPIPLGCHNDFGNTVFIISNQAHDLFLFQRTKQPIPIPEVDNRQLCHAINYGDYSDYPTLSKGQWLLQVTDSNAWVGRRGGHAYGHFRKELIRVKDGYSDDLPDMLYSHLNSRPKTWAIQAEDTFSFENIILLRDSLTTHKTYLVNLEYLSNVFIHNVEIRTPDANLLDDRIIRIYHCADILVDSLSIYGSYSATNHSGYGILMDNCRDTRFTHLFAQTRWGVFGTNNMHNTIIENSDFDRFDIHCYGRDVIFRNCRQQHSYNQFSSVYGTILFDSCTMNDFTPILIESSYNAYTFFKLKMNHCSWHLTKNRSSIMRAGRMDGEKAIRSELEQFCLPDIEINDLQVTSEKNVSEMTIFEFNGEPTQQKISGIHHIYMKLTKPSKLIINTTNRRHRNILYNTENEIWHTLVLN